MMNKNTNKTFTRLSFLFLLGVSLYTIQPAKAESYTYTNTFTTSPDSIGTENINGKRYVIHRLAPKETYYQLSRIYGVAVNEIMEANNKKSLRVGDTVRIPREAALVENKPASTPNSTTKDKEVLINPKDITEYKVGKTETLYAISRRFGISVDDIKKVNGMSNDILHEGQILKIPNKSLPKPTPVAVEPPVLPTVEATTEKSTEDEYTTRANKYGIRENKERGVGVWMSDLENHEHTALALHKTAPIGTILKITNPMNRSVTFAKVVGKFSDNHETQGAIVIISKSVASSIGILDKRFQVEIAYGVPLN